jgi:hypothetical protein
VLTLRSPLLALAFGALFVSTATGATAGRSGRTHPAPHTTPPTTTSPQSSQPALPQQGAPPSQAGGNSAAPGNAAPVLIDTPAVAKSVAVQIVSGVATVRPPGTSGFTNIPRGGGVPNDSVIDTRSGVITLTTALPDGTTQSASIWRGLVEIRQAPDGMTDIYLRGRIACPSRHAARAASASRLPRRLVWVRDNHGRFRTHGKNSIATVRGTKWLTKDTCHGTTTRVREGKVAVRNLRTHRTVVLTAGESYMVHRRG